MTSFKLKMIAITTMLIDHIGAVLFPDIIYFRIIGRLAFPLFAFLITEGFRKTNKEKKYMGRLFIFSLISQIPFWMAFGNDSGLNIFFTLTLALMALYFYEKYDNVLAVILIGLLAELMHTDYGIFGVILIFFIHIYRDDFLKMIKYITAMYLVFFILPGFFSEEQFIYFLMQLFALFSFIFIKNYNGKQGYKIKYFFYFFYPVHLILLSLIADNNLLQSFF